MDHRGRKLGRFYTPERVAEALVSMLEQNPSSIVDLGCGKGSLSLAAVERWGEQVKLTTVDADPDAGPQRGQWSRRHRHITADLLLTDPFKSLLRPKAFDLAILNPPYGREPNVIQALADGVPHGTLTKGTEIRCRATAFMLHALKATKVGGMVAAILPESLGTSSMHARNRSVLSRTASVENVTPLAPCTFAGTEVRTIMLILRKTKVKASDDAPWLHTTRTEYHNQRGLQTLENLNVEVVRGRLNTVEAREVGAFHLDGFRSAVNGYVRFEVRKQEHFDERCAREGDILVARIGRDISSKVARVASGMNAISDCVFRLRCPPEVAPRVWAGLHSEAGQHQLESAQAGVTARFLPMGSLLSIEV